LAGTYALAGSPVRPSGQLEHEPDSLKTEAKIH
jgi:hypothetical protein